MLYKQFVVTITFFTTCTRLMLIAYEVCSSLPPCASFHSASIHITLCVKKLYNNQILWSIKGVKSNDMASQERQLKIYKLLLSINSFKYNVIRHARAIVQGDETKKLRILYSHSELWKKCLQWTFALLGDVALQGCRNSAVFGAGHPLCALGCNQGRTHTCLSWPLGRHLCWNTWHFSCHLACS